MADDSNYPVGITLLPATERRNRLTTAFRFFLALPHLLLVGAPAAAGAWLGWESHDGLGLSTGTGVLGAVAGVVSMIAWFAIVFTGAHPDGLWKLSAFYLRWRVRALAYAMLLRDEYPPFGDEDYTAALVLPAQPESRDRVKVFFRILLALPHLVILGLLAVVWACTTAAAWVMILLTGRYPETLYGFAIGVFAWNVRVEAYVLLLLDDYPPFTLRA